MTTKLTLFTAALVQDSALSVSGLDRDSSSDQPFAIVDGEPTLVGRGLKGAAVAMAKRFFNPLPRAVSDDIKQGALRRSAWEFADATITNSSTKSVPRIRAGVGIRQKTGARANHVLYDREVIPAGTKWPLSFRVDWSHALNDDEGREVEGILGYVLAEHWAQGRCWLGGGAARGLGWCHLEALKVYRFDEASYETWVKSERRQLPPPLAAAPVVKPTHSWCFRTLDVNISFGEYKPEPDEAAWGLDMFAVGPHDAERTLQPTGNGTWARPTWAPNASEPAKWATDKETPDMLSTDRALLMSGTATDARPLLPGASVRGPLRHAFSRAENAAGRSVKDPHPEQGDVGPDDAAGKAFGFVSKSKDVPSESSRILIRDARAETNWSAAKLHMHAEDEFSAGSYGSAKRDAVRMLRGVFPVRIVIEGATPEKVDPLVALIDRQVALGALGHLPIGGHKTRGAGWGRWEAKPWEHHDVKKARDWIKPDATPEPERQQPRKFLDRPSDETTPVWVRTESKEIGGTALTLGDAAKLARAALGNSTLIAWWCDPTIDLALTTAPTTFGREWPKDEKLVGLQVDEVAFYAERAVWRAARTSSGARSVFIEESPQNEDCAQQTTGNGNHKTTVVHTPARLHGFKRFSSENTGHGDVLLREWHVGDAVLGFTITKEQH